jgi:3-hydroxy-5-methyl-1-naphthoate 3-O-methyltransferase
VLPVPPSTDPSLLYRYRDAACATDALVVAIAELDLLTEVARSPGTIAELALRLGVAVRPLDVIVTLLRSLGVIEPGNVVRCTALGRDHLVRGSEFFLRPYFTTLAMRPQVRALLDVLHQDKPSAWTGAATSKAWVDAMQGEGFAEEFTAAMDCRGVYLAPALAKALDLSRSECVLDIAGGSGIYACALVDQNPGLRATVLERTPMDRVASRHISQRGFTGRVAVLAGDMFEDAYPTGHDVHLLSNVLHDWDEAAVRRLLGRSAAALPVGGRLVIHDAWLNAEKSGPLEVAEYSVFLMFTTVGRCYAVSELSGWLEPLGFGPITHVPTAGYRSAIVATKLEG